MWLAPADLTVELALGLRRMEPFGVGNPEPVFGLRGVRLCELRLLGADGGHLSCSIAGFKAIWWGHGRDIDALRARSANPLDVRFTVEYSDYGGSHVELRVISVSDSSKTRFFCPSESNIV